jgi:hypothetical protein
MSGIAMSEVNAGRTNVKRNRLTPVEPNLAVSYLSNFTTENRPSDLVTVRCYFCQVDSEETGMGISATLACLVPYADILRLQAESDGRNPEFSKLVSAPDSQLAGKAYLCRCGHVSSLERYGQTSETTNQ